MAQRPADFIWLGLFVMREFSSFEGGAVFQCSDFVYLV